MSEPTPTGCRYEDPTLPKGALVLEGVGKAYRSWASPGQWLKTHLLRRPAPPPKWVLRDLSLTLAPGESLGVIGQNGAGKSTLLQLIAGTLAPTTGTLRYHGRISALLELGAGFHPEFTGRENAKLAAALLGLTPDEIAARLPQIFAFADIGEALDRPVKTYSSGMFVRLAFAVATAVDPDILIIDEALAVGDGAFARKSFDKIMQLRDSGATLLFCSHALYQVRQICTRALWLQNGRAIMNGDPEEVVVAYQEYLDSQQEYRHLDNPQVDPSHSSPAKIRTLRLRIDGIDSEEAVAFSGKSTLQLTVAFDYQPTIPPPNVGIILHTADRKSLSSWGTHVDKFQRFTTHPDGIHEVSLVIKELPLLAGNYSFSIFLLCERGIHIYDQCLWTLPFQVQGNENLLGNVLIPHQWEA
jgi:lipopolysaccharide transport system ATP-binding protein